MACKSALPGEPPRLVSSYDFCTLGRLMLILQCILSEGGALWICNHGNRLLHGPSQNAVRCHDPAQRSTLQVLTLTKVVTTKRKMPWLKGHCIVVPRIGATDCQRVLHETQGAISGVNMFSYQLLKVQQNSRRM